MPPGPGRQLGHARARLPRCGHGPRWQPGLSDTWTWAPGKLGGWAHVPGEALLRQASLPQGERPEDGAAEGLNHNQGLNRLMLAVRDMMANFHFRDLEAPHEEPPEGDGEWD